jgi:hypothetical protein
MVRLLASRFHRNRARQHFNSEMYGTVPVTASLSLIRALPHGKKPGALAIPKLNYQFGPRL